MAAPHSWELVTSITTSDYFTVFVEPTSGGIVVSGPMKFETLFANINTSDGFDINPGSDADADLITVGVTGGPALSWDESADSFVVNKPVAIANADEGGTARLTRHSVCEAVTLSGATSVTTVDIPSGAVLLGASFAVNTAVSDTTADPDTWSAAFSGGSTTALASAAAAAVDTKVNKLIVPEVASNTTNITFTPQGGEFDGGVIEVVVYYEALTSLADA
jgi:hypothetical protein